MKHNIPLDKMTKPYIDLLLTKEDLTPYETIVLKCFDCCAYDQPQSKNFFAESKTNVMECTSSCPLNKIIKGAAFGTKATKVPKSHRELTPEQREAARKRAEHARSCRMNS